LNTLAKTDALAASIPDGSHIALAPDYSGCALEVVRALVRRRARDLHLIGCPQLGLQAELLIAGGCVAGIETAAIGLGESGRAPAFARAYSERRIRVIESTCPAIHSGLQAAEKGLRFMPVASILGSGLVAARPDWRVIVDPFSGGDILLVPAIRPDVALFHVPLADRDGNAWIGVRRELMLMAHAARRSIVTAERIHESSLLRDPALAAGTIPALYLSDLSQLQGGARPNGLFGVHDADLRWLGDYLNVAHDEVALGQFIDAWAAA